VIGPLHWKAALYERPAPPVAGQKGRPRKKGDRLPTPKAMLEDVTTYPAELQTVVFPQTTRELRLQVIRDVLWYRGCKTEPVVVLLERDPLGQWRDEALVATDPSVSAEFILRDMAGAGVWNQRSSTASSTSTFTIRGSGASGVGSGRTRWRGSSGR
jgi:hypothetical protein